MSIAYLSRGRTNHLRAALTKIGSIIDNLDVYDDYVDDTHSHSLWIDRHEEALEYILKIIERSCDDGSN